MGVMTFSEYEQKKSDHKEKKDEGFKQEKSKISQKPSSTYHLFYSENVKDNYANFEGTVILDDKEYTFKVVNGVAKIKNKILADYLVSKGYELIEEEKNASES